MTSRGYQKNVFSRRMRDLSFEVQQRAKSPCPTEPRSYGSTTQRPVSGQSMASSFDIFQEEDHENIENVSKQLLGVKGSNAKWAHHVQHIPTKNIGNGVRKVRPPMSARSLNSTSSSRVREGGYFFEHELRNSTESLPNPKLGKPTRTTILRARQRCQSAPVNAYEKRREHQKKFDQSTDFHNSLMDSVSNNLQDIVTNAIPSGETVHSYLTGARYNRSDCLDSKSLSTMGIYMPRNDPQNLFVVKGYVPKNVPPDPSVTPMPSDAVKEIKEDSQSDPQPNYPEKAKMVARAETHLRIPSRIDQEVSQSEFQRSDQDVSLCKCQRRVPSVCAHTINITPQGLETTENSKERRASYPGIGGRKLSSQQTPHHSSPCRRSAPDSPLSVIHVKGKAMVLGRAVPKAPSPSLNNPGLQPPTTTPRCQSVTALDVGRKLLAEGFGCSRCDCLVKTLTDSTLAVLATEQCALLHRDSVQCSNCVSEKNQCPPNTDDHVQRENAYPGYNQAPSHIDDTDCSSLTNSTDWSCSLKDSTYKCRHPSKPHNQTRNQRKTEVMEKFQTQYNSIPVACQGRNSWSPNKRNIANNFVVEVKPQNASKTDRKDTKKVPLFLIDVKIKKARKRD